MFSCLMRPPEMDITQLGMSLGSNHAVVEALKNSEPSELDAPAWEETQQEVEQGWLRPCEVDDLREVHIAKRFPIQQGGKLRLIDDFTVAGVNQTVDLAKAEGGISRRAGGPCVGCPVECPSWSKTRTG